MAIGTRTSASRALPWMRSPSESKPSRASAAAYFLASPSKTPAAMNAGSMRISIACSIRVRGRSKEEGRLTAEESAILISEPHAYTY